MTTTIKAVFHNQNVFPLGSTSDVYLETQTGFVFTRNCRTTVQTSESAVDDTALVNYPTFGRMRSDGFMPSGLVIQQRVRNIIATAPSPTRRLVLGAPWVAGGTGNTVVYPSESPVVNPTGISGTGVGGSFIFVPSTFSVYFDHGADTALRFCYSFWYKSRYSHQTTLENSAQTAWVFFSAAPSNEWARGTIVKGTTSMRRFVPLEGRTITGGMTAQQRQTYFDFMQVEAGDWPSECMGDMGNVFNREPDMLRWPDGTQILSGGQIHFRAVLTPKFASTMEVYNCTIATTVAATAYHYLYSWGTTGENRAAIRYSDHKLYVKYNNTGEIVSTEALAWGQYDLMEIEVKTGSNLTSLARYRLNNGSWVVLTMANVVQVPAPTGEVGILHDRNSDDGSLPETFPCWLHEVEFPGTTSGVTPTELEQPTVSMCPGLHEHDSSTIDTLVLVPSKAGRAVVRVEKAQAGLTHGPYPGDS